MKKIIYPFFLLLFFINNNSFAQATIQIQSLQYTNNGQSTVNASNCGNIDMMSSTSTSINFGILLSRPFNQVFGLSDLYVYTQKSSADPRITRYYQQVPETFWTQPSSGNGTYFTPAPPFLINSSDFNTSGGTLYVVFKSGGIEYLSCSYTITKAPVPTFSLFPPSLSLGCNDLNPRTFTVTSSNIPNGANLVYSWSYSGWSGPTSNANTITLTPSSGTNLPTNVSVTPVLNGVNQPTITCTVNRASFSSTASISGTQNICSGLATYNLAGLLAGETVSWILSNPALATIVSSSNTAATISFNGTANGVQVLSAMITNACGQTTSRTFQINNGLASFISPAILTGNTANGCSGSRVFTISNLPVAQNVIWSVSNPSVATLSGASNTQVTLNLVGNGSVTLQARISNSCGQFSLKSVTLYAGTPRLTSFSCATQSKPFCSGIVTEIAAAVPNLPNVNDKITASFSGMSGAEINTSSNWEWRRLNNRININGISSSCTIGCLSFGFTGVEVRARNSCGWSAWFPLNWELVEVPDPLMKKSDVKNAKLMVTPNPSNSSWNFTFPNTKITNITITDGLGKNVYTKNFTKNEAVIDCSTLQKGIYFAKVTTALGNETVKLLKN